MTGSHTGKPSFDGFTQEDWDEVSDNPEIPAAEFAQARLFTEVFPEVAETLRRRGSRKSPVKRLISLRLDPDVVDHFRATGPGWQSRINAALREKLRPVDE